MLSPYTWSANGRCACCQVGHTSKKSPFHPNEDRVIVVDDLSAFVNDGNRFPARIALFGMAPMRD